MKSLRLHQVGDLRLQEEPIPSSNPGEALLRVGAVGICGSDIHWYAEGSTGDNAITSPFVLGHEFAGTVTEGELEGQRVAVEPIVPCLSCEFCLEGNPNLCTNHYFAGQAPQDGAMREYMAWPTFNYFPLPEAIDLEAGAMLEPLGIAIHTVDLGKVKPGMTVGVYGCGTIGLLTLQVARAAGASRLIATDRLPHRLEFAQSLGTTDLFLADGHSENQVIREATRGRGVDVTFETAGENEAVETAVETVKPGGRVVLCGIPSNNRTSYRASAARQKGLTIKMVRRMKHTYPRAIKLVETGQVDVKSIITHRFPLDQYEEAFEVAESQVGVKVILNL
jgi:L-iditol 2-dehydrogenase